MFDSAEPKMPTARMTKAFQATLLTVASCLAALSMGLAHAQTASSTTPAPAQKKEEKKADKKADEKQEVVERSEEHTSELQSH